jgi:hypothetical protein
MRYLRDAIDLQVTPNFFQQVDTLQGFDSKVDRTGP